MSLTTVYYVRPTTWQGKPVNGGTYATEALAKEARRYYREAGYPFVEIRPRSPRGVKVLTEAPTHSIAPASAPSPATMHDPSNDPIVRIESNGLPLGDGQRKRVVSCIVGTDDLKPHGPMPQRVFEVFPSGDKSPWRVATDMNLTGDSHIFNVAGDDARYRILSGPSAMIETVRDLLAPTTDLADKVVEVYADGRVSEREPQTGDDYDIRLVVIDRTDDIPEITSHVLAKTGSYADKASEAVQPTAAADVVLVRMDELYGLPGRVHGERIKVILGWPEADLPDEQGTERQRQALAYEDEAAYFGQAQRSYTPAEIETARLIEAFDGTEVGFKDDSDFRRQFPDDERGEKAFLDAVTEGYYEAVGSGAIYPELMADGSLFNAEQYPL